MRKPDFFVVGAPKCGTTAMDLYLKQHPEVFVLEKKEPQFFGTDLHSSQFIRDVKEYLYSFSKAQGERRAGETSVWSLYSRRAAAEIKAFEPSAKIIIMLRNPVEMIPSLHRQYLYTGNEDIESLEAALDAEEDRKKGRRIPETATFVQGLFYRDTARYAQQIQRYFDVFDPDNVHVVMFDDFKEDPAKTYEGVLRFLDVTTNFQPRFQVVNPSKRVHSKALRNLSKHPSKGARQLVRTLIPRPVRHGLIRVLDHYNTRYEPPPPVDPKLLERIRAEFAPEVEQLGSLLNRDLSQWSAPRAISTSDLRNSKIKRG